MLLASQGALRATTRNASNLVHHGPPNGPGHAGGTNARSIHISSFLKHGIQQPRLHVPTIPTRSPAHKLFTHTRSFLTNVIAQLTAPGLRVPVHGPAQAARSLHTASRATIQQGFSLPVRTALHGRGGQNLFLPRAPAPAARGMTQVGLGTARNFSSGRPIFQNLVENVPIAGRALYDAADDWDLKMRKDQDRMHRLATGKGKKAEAKKSREMLKPKHSTIQAILEDSKADSAAVTSEELEHYFSAAPVAPVTTFLLIPLAPTPTNRVPLAPSPPLSTPSTRLLPLPLLASIHASHSTHALRVSTLFTRLDQANVWSRGVKCSAYGQGQRIEWTEDDAAAAQACTVLKVEFAGWTAAEVRGVIGESGSGWCVLEEVRPEEEEDEDGYLSDSSSVFSGAYEDWNNSTHNVAGMEMPARITIDPAQSFVLPTLDFSSSFISSSSRSSPSTTSDDLFSTPSEFDDPWVDASPVSSPSLSSVSSRSDMSSWVDPPSTNGWFFSSQFANRSGISGGRGVDEPREQMFY